LLPVVGKSIQLMSSLTNWRSVKVRKGIFWVKRTHHECPFSLEHPVSQMNDHGKTTVLRTSNVGLTWTVRISPVFHSSPVVHKIGNLNISHLSQ
jgi:hypothetical protein